MPFSARSAGFVPESMSAAIAALLELRAEVKVVAEQALEFRSPEIAAQVPIEIVRSSLVASLDYATEVDLIWTSSEFLLRALRAERSPVRSIPMVFTPAWRLVAGAQVVTELLRDTHAGTRTDLLSLIPSMGRSSNYLIDDESRAIQHVRFLAAVAPLAQMVITGDSALSAKLLELNVESVAPNAAALRQALESLCATPVLMTEVASTTSTPIEAGASCFPQILKLEDAPRDKSDRSSAPVEVVVPIYNAPVETRACLQAVFANTDRPFSLILVDDQSPDPESVRLLDEVLSWTRPATLRRLIILRNARNLGFAASVNRALALTAGDVVLLNSDTVPPVGWLTELEQTLSWSQDIASVTPWSNNGTICSIPKPCVVNPFPEPERVVELQHLLREFRQVPPPTIPTGVGFCMLISRKALDRIGFFDSDTFSPMYGEENDWCGRAVAAGMRNVLAPTLFVPHHPSASLSTLTEPNQAGRIKNMVDLVDLFHPRYRERIAQFIDVDPLRELRHLLELRERGQQGTPLEVAICNLRLSGGSHLFIESYLQAREENERRLILDISEPTFYLLDRMRPSSTIAIPKEISNARGLSALFKWLGVSKIFINHLIGLALTESSSLLLEGEIPYEIVLHDYFAACPGVTLLRYDNTYCGAERDTKRCNACLALGTATRVPLPSSDRRLSIEVWRTQFAALLEKAQNVYICSEQQEALLSRYFPMQRYERIAFDYVQRGTQTFDDEFAFRSPLTVTVIGAIGQHKGSDIIYWLEEAIRRRTLNIRLVVIGYTDREQEPRTSHQGRFIITGRYAPSELAELLAKYETAVTLFPSIWPETYLLTMAEAQNAGYPAIVFDLGAPASRIKATGGGWVVPAPYGTELVTLLQELSRAPRAIAKEAAMLRVRGQQR